MLSFIIDDSSRFQPKPSACRFTVESELLSWGFQRPPLSRSPYHLSTPTYVTLPKDPAVGFGSRLPRLVLVPSLPFLPASTVYSKRYFAGLLHPAADYGVHHVSGLYHQTSLSLHSPEIPANLPESMFVGFSWTIPKNHPEARARSFAHCRNPEGPRLRATEFQRPRALVPSEPSSVNPRVRPAELACFRAPEGALKPTDGSSDTRRCRPIRGQSTQSLTRRSMPKACFNPKAIARRTRRPEGPRALRSSRHISLPTRRRGVI